MPLDPEVKDALDTIRDELRDELRSARTPREREAVRNEAAADLDDVLRANGYRLTRRQLDEIVSKQEDERIAAAVAAALEARDAAAAEEGDEDDEGDEGDESGKKKPPAGTKKKPPAGAAGQTEEEWV